MTDIKLTNAHIMFGDALDRLKELPDNSIDSIVTDPPYGLSDNKYVAETIIKWVNGERTFTPDGKGFMGKAWDSFVPPPAIWDECMRVLKPGGHLLAFFGSRTQDIGALSIRLAGFEIRDSIAWLYGSGFPKSMNIAKSIEAQIKTGSANKTAFKHLDGEKATVALGYNKNNNAGDFRPNDYNGRETTVNHVLHTPEAQTWEGWGTALKPAHEPIVVARKPLSESTVANNVLKWGTGGLNIDASRIGTEERTYDLTMTSGNFETTNGGKNEKSGTATVSGRFPANVILGHTEDCEPTGEVITGKTSAGNRTATFGTQETVSGGDGSGGFVGYEYTTAVYKCIDGCPVKELDRQTAGKLSPGHWAKTKVSGYGEFGNGESTYEGVGQKATDSAGGASRFFYVAKASKKDRNEGLEGLPETALNNRKEGGSSTMEVSGSPATNFHPTVKPTALMEHLVKLVTPVGGTVLDPFTGSGSTGKAALLNGFKFIGCELTEEYLPIIEGRLTWAAGQYKAKQTAEAETLFTIGEENV